MSTNNSHMVNDYFCRVFKKFRELNPSIVPKSMTANEPMTVRLPLETVAKMAELKVWVLLATGVMWGSKEVVVFVLQT